MKFDRSKAFPYPVLRPYSDDYVDGEFQALSEFEIDGDSVKVKCAYKTSSSELQAQIALGAAMYVSIISCRETYYRHTISTAEESFIEELSSSQLRGEVLVDSYIVAVKPIANYSSPDINPEFGRKRFNFRSGEILAQDETHAVFVERDLFRPISSVFDLVKNDSLTGGDWRVSLGQPNVQIQVSPKLKESIDNARSSAVVKSVLINSIYFSAVVHAVQALKDEAGYDDQNWAKVMERQIHNAHIDLKSTDAYIVAQRLMKHPLNVLDAYVFSKV